MLKYFLIFVISLSSYGQEMNNSSDIKDLKEKLLYDFKKYQQLNSSDLESNIEQLNERTSTYIKFRRQECEGEFSSVELDENGQEIVTNRKLSKIEKKLCMLELINFQKQFVDTVFIIRKKILVKNHKGQIETLEKFQREQIDNLENIAVQYK